MNALLISYDRNKPGQSYDREYRLRHMLGAGHWCQVFGLSHGRA
jgi:hypothetical protein